MFYIIVYVCFVCSPASSVVGLVAWVQSLLASSIRTCVTACARVCNAVAVICWFFLALLLLPLPLFFRAPTTICILFSYSTLLRETRLLYVFKVLLIQILIKNSKHASKMSVQCTQYFQWTYKSDQAVRSVDT